MPNPCFRLVTLLGALVLALSCGQPAAAATAPHIRPSLVAESAAPAASAATTVALAMAAEPGWHGYWQNPGSAGFPTQIEWTLPAGVTAEPPRYPVPHRLLIAGLMNYVFEGDYAHLIRLDLAPGLASGTRLPLRAHIRWLACTTEICVPEQGEVALDLVVGSGATDPVRAARFDRWRAALPRPLGARGSFARAGDRFRLAIPLPAAVAVGDPYFYPYTDGAIDYAAPQSVSRAGDTLIVETKAGPDAAKLVSLSGVLAFGDGQGLGVAATPGSVPAAGEPVTSGASRKAGGGTLAAVLLALGGAVLGGLLLNVMPCVFPILSLKALSLARAGGSAKENGRAARAEGIAYAAGAIAMCVALGAALLALRAGGSAAGWAFQLQNPRIILVLLLLVTGIALNLAGLFALPQIGVGGGLAARGGAMGAFWTGALAAFVATPCTGPFMGAALGAALVLPWGAALAVFAGLGLGLALPFLLLGFVPALRRRLPRPGLWMERLQRLLAIPMFATALGLAWILGRLSGVDAMTLGLAAALLTGGALWWVGRRQARMAGAAWGPLAPALVVAGLLVFAVPRAPAGATAPTAAVAGAEPFSEARLAALQAAGRPVFVYFTADWCLTCKVNEKTAIERSEVADAFTRHKVAVLEGDWTRGDPAITRFLAAHDRSGVPLYLYYAPGQPARTLPQVLTPGLLAGLVA